MRQIFYFRFCFLNLSCTLFLFLSRCKIKPPIKLKPATKKISPPKNCIHNCGKGGCKMPNNISLINLIPYPASSPGRSSMIKAKMRSNLTLLIKNTSKKSYPIAIICQATCFSLQSMRNSKIENANHFIHFRIHNI